ncbi:MAG TPA: DUF4129 domain-containing protein [Jiangellaceae bacterium]|nr:DUF4129 domain-containing protein [Jiangellaceae bacterium]
MSLPVELDRDEARELAEGELANPRYDSEPSLLQQAFEWLFERLSELLSSARGTLSGPMGALLLAVIILAVATILLRYGALARRRKSAAESVLGGTRRGAREYRAAAAAAAAAGKWSEAVVERFRAIIADLDERGVLHVKAGTTADEAAWTAGLALPDLVGSLSDAATMFDAIRYGGHDATSEDDRRLRALDEAVRRARPQPVAATRMAHK